MRQRSNLTILLGIAFLLIGGAIVYLVLDDADGDGGAGSSNAQSEVTVFVATGDIAPNTLGSDVIADGLLRTERVPAGAQPVGAITSAAGLDNQIIVVAVQEGEIITSAHLTVRSLSNVSIPEGFDGVAVTMSYTNGGAGYVAPGDRVNVYGVFPADGLTSAEADPQATARLPRAELLLTNVLVLDVSAQDPTSLDTTQVDEATTINRPSSGAPLTFLLAMKPEDIERLVLVRSFADLYVSLAADEAPNIGDTRGSDGTNVLAPVSASSGTPQG